MKELHDAAWEAYPKCNCRDAYEPDSNTLTIISAALAHFNVPRTERGRWAVVYEHGQPWLVNNWNSGQWSVVEANTDSGWDFEEVTAPDDD